jgi:hypothetical protein
MLVLQLKSIDGLCFMLSVFLFVFVIVKPPAYKRHMYDIYLYLPILLTLIAGL